MATDSANLPQGEATLDVNTDATGIDLDATSVQLAQVEGAQPVELPKGHEVIRIQVKPGQTIELPTDSADGLLAKIGPEGNLAIVVDGRTIILQGYVEANEEKPVKIVTNDGDPVDAVEVIAATDPSLDIQTAAGPAAGPQGNTDSNGSGIFIPFGPAGELGGLNAIGILGATALQYKLIDDERKDFVQDEGKSPDVSLSFDILGGVINEDDLPADHSDFPELASAKFILGGHSGVDGEGNDPFDSTDREKGGLDSDGDDGFPDPDREPLQTEATIKVNFNDGSGSLKLDLTLLPSGLKSEGETITYQLIPGSGGVGDVIIGFVNHGGDAGKFDDGDRLVFTVEADKAESTGEFKVLFSLYDNLDNTPPDANHDGKADLLGADEQILGLPVHFIVADSKGSADGTLPLGVEDDIPFFGQVDDCGIGLTITHETVCITHDESRGVQYDADDVNIHNFWVQCLGKELACSIVKAGYDLPTECETAGTLKGAAKTQVHASFGADGPSEEYYDKKAADPTARNSIFGELEDRTNADKDGINDGENEHPFELFMVTAGTDKSNVQESNLTITEQLTNCTVTWDKANPELPVYIDQIDAHTIVGYVNAPGCEGGTDKVAVFTLNIDDNGCLSFYQYHQLNHNQDGPTHPDHDDTLPITDADGNPLIYIRATDFDGDHAITPVNLKVQDDGPKFCEVEWGRDCDSVCGVGVIDEEALRHGIYGGPGDDLGGRHADGKVVFDFGVDQPGHLEINDLCVKDCTGKTVLQVSVDEQGCLQIGENCLFAIDDKSIDIEKSGPDGNGVVTWTAFIAGCPDEKVFTFSLDTCGDCMGQFDFCLLKPLEHPLTDNPATDYTEKSFEDNFKFDFTVRGFDSDGDWADGKVCLSVDDDSPDACKVEISFGDHCEDNKLVHDETRGVQDGGKFIPGDHDPDASYQDEDDVCQQPKDYAKFEDKLNLCAIGYAVTQLNVDLSGGTNCPTAAFGADGPGSVSPVSIVNNWGGNFCGEKTNLHDTQCGDPIYLYTVEECGETFVVGKVGGEHGPISFALHVSDCGDIELAQYRAIQHPDGCDSDESLTLLDCEGKALINLQVEVTDADGDTVCARTPVDGCHGNPAIVFQDDGPCVTTCDGAKVVLAMDETDTFSLKDVDDKGYPTGPKDGPTPEGDLISNLVNIFGGIFPEVVPHLLSAAHDNVADLFKVDFGTDGGCEICYDLTILCEKTNLRDTETGTCISLVDCGNGIIKGVDEQGNVVLAFYLDHNSGEIYSAQFRAIDHGGSEPAPGAFDEVKVLGDHILGVTATAYDKDGDKDCKTVDIGCGISIEDDGPKFNRVDWGNDGDSKNGIGLIDEDALPHGNPGGPGDDDGGKSADGTVKFDFGADKAGKVEINALEVQDGNSNPVLKIDLDAGGNLHVVTNALFAIDGQALAFDKSAPDADGVVTWTAFIAGHPDQKVFTFSLDTCGDNIGAFDFCLLQPLEHPYHDANNKNDGPETSYEDNFKFDFTVRGFDGDGDSADGHVKLSVDDDSPDGCKVDISFGCDGNNDLVHDETRGVQDGGKFIPGDHDPDASYQDEDDVCEQPKDYAKFEDKLQLCAIGYAVEELKIDLSGGTNDANAAFGADGPGSVIAKLVNGHGGDFCGEKTNLHDTQCGDPIFLYTVEECGESFVVGKVGGENGPISFALHISDCGDIELAQYRAIQHPDGCDSDESLTLLDCNGKDAIINIQVTVTDADCDSVTVCKPIDGCHGNPAIVFQDDGPCVTTCDSAKVVLAMDETDTFSLKDVDDKNYPTGPQDGPTPEGDLISTIVNLIGGIFPEAVPHLLSAAHDNVADLFKVDFGTDGGCEVCYDLTILCEGGKTNLRDTETGTCISLVDCGNGIVKGVDECGNVVLAFYLDHNSGEIYSAQFRAIDHGGEEPAPGAFDEVKFLAEHVLGVTATAYDKDGDKDCATVDIGCGISFEDDGPKFDKVLWSNGHRDGTEPIDEDALPNGIPGTPSVGDDAGGKSADGKVLFDFGADKAGKVEVNSLEVRDGNSNIVLQITFDAAGNPVLGTHTLEAINDKALAFEKSAPDADGVVTLTAFIAGHPDQKVFTFTLDTCGDNIGAFNFCLLQPLEHPLTDNPLTKDVEKAFEDNFKFDFTIRGYDGDGDSADGHVKLSVDDDSPKVEACENASLHLAMDETDTFNQHDYDQPGVDNGPKDGPTPEGDLISTIVNLIGGIFPEVVPHVLSAAHDNVAGLFKVGFGADGGCEVCYDLTILCDGGKTNLRDTETGTCISLVDCGNGIVKGVDEQGNVVFAVYLNHDTGEIYTAQFRAIDHGGEEPAPGAVDEVKYLAEHILGVTATATDNDGDKACTTVDIGCGISFEDDGPKADLDIARSAKIVLDESVDPAPADGFTDKNANDESGNVPNDIAYAHVAGKDLFVDNSVFGSDGEKSRVYSLGLSGDGANSGLQDSATNTAILLFRVDDDTVEGRVGGSGGAVAFRIDINAADGGVTISQFLAVEHDNAGSTASDHDESSSPEVMDANQLFLQVTVTDGDYDSDSDKIDLGKLIRFEDDGPIARDDTDHLQPGAGDTVVATGNVYTGVDTDSGKTDDGGSDTPWIISKLVGTGGTDSTTADGLGIDGKYGHLALDPNTGDYTYTLDESKLSGLKNDTTEVFTYTLKDSDGDTDTATLTIDIPVASVETSAIVNPQGGSYILEDTYTTLHLNAAPGSDDTVTQIVLSNVPADWDVKAGDFLIGGGSIVGTPTFAAGQITFDISGATPGAPVSIELKVKAGPDSDVDGKDLKVSATSVDGAVTGHGESTFTVVVDAVADGDDKGDDGDSDKLGVTIALTETTVDGNTSFQASDTGNVHVTATFDDYKDGSETHILTVDAPAGFTFGALGLLPDGVVLDAGTSTATHLVFKVDSHDGDGVNGVPSLTLDLPVSYGGGQPDGNTGNFVATVTTTEGNVVATNGDGNDEGTDTNNTDSATASDHGVITGTPSPDISVGLQGGGHCLFEDTTATFTVDASAGAGAHLTSIVLTGVPTAPGWSFNFAGLDTDGAGSNVQVDLSQVASGQVTISFSAAFGGTYNGTFTATPPADSDADFGTLNGQVTAASNTDAAVTGGDTASQYFETDAVADGKGVGFGDDGDGDKLGVSISVKDSIDADNAFALNEKGTVTVGATFDDYKDGSEIHTVTIDAPGGFKFLSVDGGSLPAGVTVQSLTDGQVILAVDSSDPGGLPSFANVSIQVQNVSAASGASVEFHATAKAEEQNTTASNGDSNKECTDANNVQTVDGTAQASTVVDLQPDPYDDKVSGTEPGARNVNVMLILDRSGSMGDEIPNSGGKTRMELMQEATVAMLNGLAANGDVRVMLVSFTTDATAGTEWLSVADAITAINALTPTNLTNYEDALNDAEDAFHITTGRGDFTDHDNLVFFMSDGVPTTGGDSNNHLTNDNLKDWDNFLEDSNNSIDQLTVVGIGKDIASNDQDLDDVADPDYTGSPADVDLKNPFGQVLIVEDENDLKDTLVTSVATKIEGNVIDGTIEDDPTAPTGGTGNDPDFQGDAPAFLSYFKYDGAGATNDITITWDGDPSHALVISGGQNVNPSGTDVTFDTDYGRMTFHFATGDFTFLPNHISGGDKDELFQYKLTDTDGDESSAANLTITIEDLVFPDTNPGSGSGAEDASDIAVALSGTDANGTVTSFKITSLPANGALYADAAHTTLLALGSIVTAVGNAATVHFVPNANFNGAPTFQYAAIDNDGLQDPTAATATITVTAVNDAPDAVAPAGPFNATEQTNLIVQGKGLSISDVDAGNGSMTVALSVGTGALTLTAGNSGATIGAGNGTSSVQVTGTVTQINNLLGGVDTGGGSAGTITFKDNSENPPASTTLTLHVEDNGNTGAGGNKTDDASVTINITSINDAPTTNNTNASGNEDAASIAVSLSGSDVDGTVSVFKITSLPTDGKLFADVALTNEITLNETVTALANAAVVYFVPNHDFNGAQSFQYAAIDNGALADASPATASITVNSVADPTVANPDSIITAINDDASFTVPHWALLANDSDGDGPLSINQIVSFDGTNFDNVSTGGGNVTINTDDPFDPGDTALFTYKATDGTSSANAVVTVSAVGNGNITGTDNGEIIVDNDNGHTINAGKGNDIVFGNDGDDIINGGDGDDYLDGGEGGDTYTGGKGTDTIDVGDGNDTVNYTSTLDGSDVILNFDGNSGGGGQDTINLDALFDALGVASGSRAGRVQIVDNGDDTVDVNVNADTSNANFELHVVTIHTTNTITVGQDVLVQ